MERDALGLDFGTLDGRAVLESYSIGMENEVKTTIYHKDNNNFLFHRYSLSKFSIYF